MNETIPTHRSLFNFIQLCLSELTSEAKIYFVQKKAGKFLSSDHTSKEEKANNALIEELEKDYTCHPQKIDATTYMDKLSHIYSYFDSRVLNDHVDPEDLEDPDDTFAHAHADPADPDDVYASDEEEEDMWPSEQQDWTVPAPNPKGKKNFLILQSVSNTPKIYIEFQKVIYNILFSGLNIGHV